MTWIFTHFTSITTPSQSRLTVCIYYISFKYAHSFLKMYFSKAVAKNNDACNYFIIFILIFFFFYAISCIRCHCRGMSARRAKDHQYVCTFMTYEHNFVCEFNLPQTNGAHKYTRFTVTINLCQFKYSVYISFAFDISICCKLLSLKYTALRDLVFAGKPLLVWLSKMLW